ncbi:hypothetical protein VP01_6933g1, partial [Puccinia sorghi]
SLKNSLIKISSFWQTQLIKNFAFTYHLAQSRVRIEYPIGILKGIKINWIISCVILHNPLADLKDQWNELYKEDAPDSALQPPEAHQCPHLTSPEAPMPPLPSNPQRTPPPPPTSPVALSTTSLGIPSGPQRHTNAPRGSPASFDIPSGPQRHTNAQRPHHLLGPPQRPPEAHSMVYQPLILPTNPPNSNLLILRLLQILK